MTLISASLCTLWLAGVWALTKDRVGGWCLNTIAAFACIIAIAVAGTNVFSAVIEGYPRDSFWTLSAAGRIGVLAISTTGIALIFNGITWKSNAVLRLKRPVSGTAWLLVDVAMGFVIFGVLHSISPQIFYELYRWIFADLPRQWVIDGLWNADRLAQVMSLPAGGSLADHLAGVVAWAIIPFTAWHHLRHWWRG